MGLAGALERRKPENWGNLQGDPEQAARRL